MSFSRCVPYFCSSGQRKRLKLNHLAQCQVFLFGVFHIYLSPFQCTIGLFKFCLSDNETSVRSKHTHFLVWSLSSVAFYAAVSSLWCSSSIDQLHPITGERHKYANAKHGTLHHSPREQMVFDETRRKRNTLLGAALTRWRRGHARSMHTWRALGIREHDHRSTSRKQELRR